MSERLSVQEPDTLLPFLFAQLSGWSRKKVKQRLQSGCITVNEVSVTQHNHPLAIGDQVEVFAKPKVPEPEIAALKILYQDNAYIAINKPAGLLSVANPKSDEPHALGILRRQLSRPSQPVKLWPVHRIDRGTSGVLLFATSHDAREELVAQWSQVDKTYLAVVEGRPKPEQGTIDKPLYQDEQQYFMHVGQHPQAKKAVTHYKTLKSQGKRSLLQIRLETGRQHQIRAHLSWLGYPVVGDPRYGTQGSRLGLHALRLGLMLPGKETQLWIEATIPADFSVLLAQQKIPQNTYSNNQ